MRKRMRWLLAGALVVMLGMASSVTAATTRHSTGGAALPPPTGLGLQRNRDAEPGIATDANGTIWIASDVNPNETADPRSAGDVLTGADVWKSTNGGKSFTYVGSPFSTAKSSNPGLAGEDTDMAAAPVHEGQTAHVYAASLWLGATSLATSTDGGATWSLNPLGGVPVQDRPWIAASGPCTVYLLYHQLPAFEPFVNTYDTCTLTNNAAGVVLPAVSQAPVAENQVAGNVFNKLVVDNGQHSPHKGAVYVPLQVCETGGNPQTFASDEAGSCSAASVVIGVSTDGAKTFSEHTVYTSSTLGTPVWGATVAVDGGGNVYASWADKSSAWVSVSHDAGQTWSHAVRLNTPRATRTAVYPTVAGGANGQVAVAWYGTDRFSSTAGSDDSKVMGRPGADDSAAWYVWLAESRDGGRTWKTARMTGIIHRGIVCTGGSGCSGNGDRNLYDDFGVVLSPTTNRATIAYSADLPGGKSTDTFTGFVSERCRLFDRGCLA